MCSTRNTYKTHGYRSHNYSPNFRTIRRAVLEIRKRGLHVRTCSSTRPVTSVKRLGNVSLTTYQISAQSVQPFPRCRQGGTSARAAISDWHLDAQMCISDAHLCGFDAQLFKNVATAGRQLILRFVCYLRKNIASTLCAPLVITDTSKTPFGRWTSGSERMYLNVCTLYSYMCARADIPHSV